MSQMETTQAISNQSLIQARGKPFLFNSMLLFLVNFTHFFFWFLEWNLTRYTMHIVTYYIQREGKEALLAK